MRRGWTPTMRYRRGDVVLVPFPYGDLKKYKQRPALVVQDEKCPTGLSKQVIAQITSTARSGPSRVAVSQHSAEGRNMGLLTDSVVVADHLATVDDTVIKRALGRCTNMEPINAALKAALGLTT